MTLMELRSCDSPYRAPAAAAWYLTCDVDKSPELGASGRGCPCLSETAPRVTVAVRLCGVVCRSWGLLSFRAGLRAQVYGLAAASGRPSR